MQEPASLAISTNCLISRLVFIGKMDLKGTSIFFQVLELLRARNGNDIIALL